MYVSANIVVISNTSDNRNLTKQNLVSGLYSKPLNATKNVAVIKQ